MTKRKRKTVQAPGKDGIDRKKRKVVADTFGSSLEQARTSHQSGEYRSCLKLLQELLAGNSEYVLGTEPSALFLAAHSALELDKFSEAYRWAKQATELESADIDCQYLLAVSAFELREFGQSVQMIKEVIDVLEKEPARDGRHMPLRDTLPRLHNLHGMSHYHLADFVEAEKSVQRAIKLDGDQPRFYIDLAVIRKRRGDKQGEQQAIRDGLIHCTEKDELNALAASWLRPATISLCMIVKNEEKMLPRCLESVQGLVDEIIVVDTGSEDRTVQVAKSFGAKVYHHSWQDDFSLHRNQSLSYAESEWILVMDADEELECADHDKLRQALKIPDISIVSISVHNIDQKSGKQTSFLPSVRLFRRGLNLRYDGIVHNQLKLPESEAVLSTDVRLYHCGYSLAPEVMQKKYERSKTLLRRQIEKNRNDPFANFNYSQILRGESENPTPDVCEQIIGHSRQAVEHSDPDKATERHIHLMALDQLAGAYFHLGEYGEAEKCAQRALGHDPDYIDPMFALGHIYTVTEQFEKAIAVFESYLKLVADFKAKEQTNNYILLHLHDQASAWYALGMIHAREENFDQARQCFVKVLTYSEDHLDTHGLLARLYYKRREFDRAWYHAEKRLQGVPNDTDILHLFGEIELRRESGAAAREWFRQALEHDPEHRQTAISLMSMEQQAGNYTAALDWASRILRNDPTDGDALAGKAGALMSLGKYHDAIDTYDQVVGSNQQSEEILNDIGNCYFKLADYEVAIRYYSEALALNPRMAIAIRNLGYTYFRSGDQHNALKKLKLYLDYVPDDFDILYLVSQLEFEDAHYEEAIRYVESCVTMQPHSAELLTFLSNCYLNQGHHQSARLGYLQAVKADPEYLPAKEMLSRLNEIEKTAPPQQ